MQSKLISDERIGGLEKTRPLNVCFRESTSYGRGAAWEFDHSTRAQQYSQWLQKSYFESPATLPGNWNSTNRHPYVCVYSAPFFWTHDKKPPMPGLRGGVLHFMDQNRFYHPHQWNWSQSILKRYTYYFCIRFKFRTTFPRQIGLNANGANWDSCCTRI